MLVRGSAWNGASGDGIGGASIVVVNALGVAIGSAVTDEMGQWSVALEGNPGSAGDAVLTYLGRRRDMFAGTRRMGFGPSWDPA